MSVRDTGIGIPADVAAEHLRHVLARWTAAIERSTGGLGIGLALVKGLVEMHGGTVDGRERRARARAARSPSRLPVLRSQPEPPAAAPDGERPRPGRGGASWWWTTTGTGPTSLADDAAAAGQRGPHGPRRRRGGGGGRASSGPR